MFAHNWDDLKVRLRESALGQKMKCPNRMATITQMTWYLNEFLNSWNWKNEFEFAKADSAEYLGGEF